MISKADRRKENDRWIPKPWKGHKGSAYHEPHVIFDELTFDSFAALDDRAPSVEEVHEHKSEIMQAIEFLGLDPRIRYGLGKQKRKEIIAEYRDKKEQQENFTANLAAL